MNSKDEGELDCGRTTPVVTNKQGTGSLEGDAPPPPFISGVPIEEAHEEAAPTRQLGFMKSDHSQDAEWVSGYNKAVTDANMVIFALEQRIAEAFKALKDL